MSSQTLTLAAARPGATAQPGAAPAAAAGSARVARGLQITLGILWLIDGALQLQPAMFGRFFISDVLLPSAAGQPSVIAAPITWISDAIAPHVAVFNAGAALVQLAIGAGLLHRRTVRMALSVSFAWALAIWWLGEGLGGLATGTADPLSGAPGAAALYLLAGAMAWPGDRPLGLLGARGARRAWTALWLGFTVLWMLPANRTPQAVHDAVGAAPAGAAWLGGLEHAVARATAGSGTGIAAALAAVSVAIAIGGELGAWWARASLWAATALELVYWVVGQGLGGVLAGGATDVGTAPLVILIAAALIAQDAGGVSGSGDKLIVR